MVSSPSSSSAVLFSTSLSLYSFVFFFSFFFFNDTATTDIYTLSLHDALPIYGSSHIGATAKDISNVVTDAASGVVDIFHGIDKAVADTWNNFWKDGKADGIGSNLSRK